MHSPETRAGERGREVTDVDVLIQGYSTYLAALKKSPRTVGEYTKDVTRWAKWWKRPVEFFHQDEWDDWVAHLDADGLQGKTIRRNQSSLRRFFKYLRRRKICANDPAKDSESVGIVKKVPEFLLESEVGAIIDAADSASWRAIFELLYSCGLRNEECRTLKLSQVAQTYLQIHGKGNKERVVPLGAKARAALDAWLAERDSQTDAVFPGRGGPLSHAALRLAFNRALRVAGITRNVTPHAMRHSIATHLAARGVPVERIQLFLGHESLETTMIYVHLARQLTGSIILQAHPRA